MQKGNDIMECQFDAYCGLYCGACDVLQANIENRHGEMAVRLGNKEENFICHGCKTDKVSQWCGQCKIRSCAFSRHVEFCMECPDFPCDDWTQFSTNSQYIRFHENALPNMEYIQAKGLSAWLDQQDKKWRCVSCGQKMAWTESVCRSCGARIDPGEE